MQTVSYIGDGSTTEFNFNFPYYENTNIIVTKNNAPATGYQIIGTSGGADADIPYVGGKVVFEVAPTYLDSITISRQLPLSRAIDYQPTAHIDPTTLNQDMNYMIEVLKDFLDELEIFHNQYADIADKTSTQTLLAQIAIINQMVADGEIMDVDKFYSYNSNCITQIPQDIKLTLASGAITLKTGSKVYIPNGSGTFDTVTIASDITVSAVANRKTTIFYKNGALQRMNTEYCYSGATAPTPGAATAIWYDTTNNVIKFTSDSGSTWATDNISLPICAATETTTGFTSIDQIFNGFGFIGASVFALPGVKGMIPNGRNADGTLKNTEFTLSNVLVTTDSSGATGALEFYLNNSGIYRSNVGTNTYNEALNIITNSSGVQQNVISLDTNAYRTNGAVTSFNPKFNFRAVDYSDKGFIAHQAMPSGKYLNLTLGTTGATYTAPVDGYYTLVKSATASGQYINMINGSNGISSDSIATGAMDCRVFMPVSRGDVVTINYTTAGTTGTFRFVYANGAK